MCSVWTQRTIVMKQSQEITAVKSQSHNEKEMESSEINDWSENIIYILWL